MQIQVNGELREMAAPASLQDLISTLNLKAERLAIELNGEVVRLVDWARTELRDNDKVEIVHFVGGGSALSSVQEVTQTVGLRDGSGIK